MTLENRFKTIALLCCAMLLTACQLPPKMTQEVEQFVAQVETQLQRSNQELGNPNVATQLIQEYSTPWIGPPAPIHTATAPHPAPANLSQSISLTFVEPISLAELGHQIATQIEIPISIAGTIQNTQLATLHWNGTAKAALDHITSRLGISWRARNDQIEIFHTDLGMWTLFVPAIDAKWQASVGLSGSVQGGSGGSDLQAQDKVVVSLDTATYWDEVESLLSGLISKDGRFTLNRLTGELTVIDIPVALQRVSQWVAVKNQELTTQVLVNFDLYEIHHSNSAATGFNLSGFIQNAFGKSAARVRLGSNDSGGFVGLQLTHSPTQAVDGSDIELLLRNSEGVSRVAKLTSTVIRGLNGLPVPVFFGDETSYLAKREVVNSDGTTEVRLVPDKVQDGIAINMLPQILPDSNRLMMNLTIRTTRIKEIRRFPQDAGPNDPVIQLPNLESRSALLPVVLNSGELLFVAGLDTYRSDDSDNKAIFGKESDIKTARTSLVLLITPYIIRPTLDYSGRRQWRPQDDHSSVF